MTGLAATQRWIQRVITDPEGVEAGLAGADEAAAPALAAGVVVCGSARLSAPQRLDLYSRTYRRRLVGCLRESYPGMRHALGDELFDDFALDYLRTQPPRGYTLATLGAGWPGHLEATRPDRACPAHERERWPDFLVDLARLERIFCEVYDGPGTEGDAVASAHDLPAADDATSWRAVTVTPVVCLSLLRASFPVAGYLAAVRRGDDPPMPAPATSFIAVSRRDYVVTITEIDVADHALLDALMDGRSVTAAADVVGVSLAHAARRLHDWADRGLIAAVHAALPPRPGTEHTRGAVGC